MKWKNQMKLQRKAVSRIMLALLLTSVFTLAFGIQPVKAEPRTWTVDDDGPADFNTIQEAINAADPGDTIFVHAGTYYEHVFIGKPISLIGENRDNTIIDGNLTGTVVNVTASNVIIAGFTVQRSYQYSSGYGIYISEDSTNNSITDNIIANDCDGIWLAHSSNNIISGNNVTGNYRGIYVDRSPNNMISKNNIEKNEYGGIYIGYLSPDNFVIKNNITNNGDGIVIGDEWGNNTISRNTIMNNTGAGVHLWRSKYNIFYDNNIINNEYGVAESFTPSNNLFYHNNVIDNTYQVEYGMEGRNIWDNCYPSGGNYWNDFEERYPDVKDVYSGPYQNETGSDGIWDHSYSISGLNQDNYPLMNPWIPSGHELIVFTLTTPASITLGESSLLNATVTNQGVNDEENVEFELLVNGTIVDSVTIPLLQVGDLHLLSYQWTPTIKGTYNITAYVHPLLGETSIENNQKTRFTTVWAVGVKAGDWIKYEYTVTGAPSGITIPIWIKVEIPSVEGTNVTIRLTMSMPNGTESSETLTLDVARTLAYGTGGTFDTLFGFGFVIPANSTVGGDYIYIMLLSPAFMLGKQIDGEVTRTYAGASRTVVYATFSYIGARYGNNPLKYYWDKQTGVMVEASATLDGMTATAKATETNMWETATTGEGEEVPFWMQWWLWAIVAVAVVAVAGTFCFFKRRKPPTPTAPSLPTEAT